MDFEEYFHGFWNHVTSSARGLVKANTANFKWRKEKEDSVGIKGLVDRCSRRRSRSARYRGGSSRALIVADCWRTKGPKSGGHRKLILKGKTIPRLMYRLPKKYCLHCQKGPLGRVCEKTQMGPGNLVEIYHHMGDCRKRSSPDDSPIPPTPGKHTDETKEPPHSLKWPAVKMAFSPNRGCRSSPDTDTRWDDKPRLLNWSVCR